MEVLREAIVPSSSGSSIVVSILVLMEVLREARSKKSLDWSPMVSILVLMEVLREARGRPTGFRRRTRGFQSLF